jgi:hypothetical protein
MELASITWSLKMTWKNYLSIPARPWCRNYYWTGSNFSTDLLQTQNALNFVNFSSSLLKKKWLFTSCNFRFIKNKKVLLRIKWTYFWLSAKTQSMQTRELKSLFFTYSSKLRRLRNFFLKCSSIFMIFHHLCSIKNN